MAKKRTLYVGRHAKSSWDFPAWSDIDRPLAERGLRNAYDMAQRMKYRGEEPWRIISSPANRAMHTAMIYARELRIPMSRFFLNEGLYMSGEDYIMKIISEIDESEESVMIFGHNPDFTYFANNFLKDKINNIPTSGVVKLVFDASDWKEIHRRKLAEFQFDYPKKK
jgi:phosphohistidine phosphatase